MSGWFTLALGVLGAGALLLLGYAIGSWRQYQWDSAALQHLAAADMIHPNCANVAQWQMELER